MRNNLQIPSISILLVFIMLGASVYAGEFKSFNSQAEKKETKIGWLMSDTFREYSFETNFPRSFGRLVQIDYGKKVEGDRSHRVFIFDNDNEITEVHTYVAYNESMEILMVNKFTKNI